MATKILCLLICCYLLLAGDYRVVSGLTPVIYNPQSTPECGQDNPLKDDQLMEALGKIHQELGPPGCNPPQNKSCQEIFYCFPSAPSGYYQIRVPNGSLVQVYCDMEGTNCGGEGGWMRVTFVNMSQSGATCPQGLTQTTLSGLTLCGRNGPVGCQRTEFSTLGLNYSQVCGQLRGYQRGSPDAFGAYNLNPSESIDDPYVDGASITYGSAPRKHIWTYANGVNLVYHQTHGKKLNCPCNEGNPAVAPPYVGSDYYCETGDNDETCCDLTLFSNDPLWDGQQCPGEEALCCTHPNMPWFKKTLSETTTEDIELRVCGDETTGNEDTLLQVIELFVL